jgi:hypothetical protein
MKNVTSNFESISKKFKNNIDRLKKMKILNQIVSNPITQSTDTLFVGKAMNELSTK